MNLPAGTRIGAYEIVALIGGGGMGEVYRAHDPKLNRDVAIKVLLPSVAGDADRVARFQREAQVLAALDHPGIANIFGTVEANGETALVLELIEGEDLAERIARGPIPVDEALSIALQIAHALQAAHELGIIHRDLKPANVKLQPDGTVKVLDFGLARVIELPGRTTAAVIADSPTVTSPAMMTGVGVILGTAAYMSPEQAKGRLADKRSDVWAFGCVLYEMLTGRRGFDGEELADVLGAVTRLEPDWDAVPGDVPQPVRTLLKACLIKDRRLRVADISTCVFILNSSASLGTAANTAAPRPGPVWRRAIALVIATVATAAVAGAAHWYGTSSGDPIPPRVSRLSIAPTGSAALALVGSNSLGITHDGSRVIYIGNRATQLFVRPLDVLASVPVFTSDVGTLAMPFASSDNRWIGFSSNGVLTKVAVTGGPATTLTTLDGAGRGATWGPDDAIIFATSNRVTGLQRVGAHGGEVIILTRPDPSMGEGDHVSPRLLPGGRAVLFTILPLSGGIDAAQVAVLNLDTGARTILVRGGNTASYVSRRAGADGHEPESGFLVYAVSDRLRAVAFDPTRLETRGDHVDVVTELAMSPIGTAQAVVAGDGTLAYVPGGAGEYSERAFVWVDRQGRETPIAAPPHRYVYPRLSPENDRIAAFAIGGEMDVWIWNFKGANLTRATRDPGIDHSPVWTPDGRELIFSSERLGIRNLFKQLANMTGAAERLIESANPQSASAVSPDGRRVIYTETTTTTGEDVMQLELDGSRRVTPLIHSSFAERNGVISPNGRWIAYESNDSSRFELFVRTYPDVTRDQWQVSTTGGTRPLWTRSGQELVYVAPDGALMGVNVGHGPSWSAASPMVVVKRGYLTMPQIDLGVTYDIAADGQRFLMIKGSQPSEQTTGPASLVIVQNWVQELKRLVPIQ